ncbi:MAG TPA: hypothetical protein VN038_05165 [Dyadobacter sp.]|nr:hypothetical protein [Dyadobacter sp.]
MNALSTTTGSEDPVCMAYGREVKALLNVSDPVSWTEDLWTIYTGFMLAQKELGYDPHIADTFCSFKELLFFFERVKEIS